MAYTNSPLVDYTRISPNKDVNRRHSIDRVTIHCVVGQCSVETLGTIFANRNKEASSNYGVGYDGKVGMYVEEKDRSWCSSSADNDNRAVTIEVASDTTYPYAVYDAAYNKTVDLVTDICKRNGKNKILWFGNKEVALNYSPAKDEMVMTVHRWFANKSCPGEFLYSRHDDIAKEVNRRLGGSAPINNSGNEVCNVYLPVLRKGDVSGYVCTMQILLNKYNNARLAEDGIFGNGTYNALMAYQRNRKLIVDGICGAQTWGQLLK